MPESRARPEAAATSVLSSPWRRAVTARPGGTAARCRKARRLEADIDLPLTVYQDSWVVALVKGTDGVSRPIWPMNPQDLTEERNTTLDDLTDGNLGEGGNPALAFTNPLFIDVDGNGRFDAPSAMGVQKNPASARR